MLTLKQQLPPLGPLVSFEAAARLRSFTAAARELNLSQAAVSQQIRNLEQSLGVSLFIRAHKSVQLSAKGRELQHTVAAVFRQLATATAELKAQPATTHITIAADQSVASLWLMPRLPRFQELHSEITVRLIASDDEQDCLNDDIQLAIIHGSGNWPGFRSMLFFEEEIFPVCNPDYASRGLTTESLAGETLLELDDIHWDWMNWRTWLSRNGVDLPARHRGLQVNNYPMLIDAARNGQGVALGWRHLVDRDIANGTLVKAVDASVKTRLGYYLVWPESVGLSPGVAAFRDWALQSLEAPD